MCSVQDCVAKYSNFTTYFKRRLENLASVAHEMMHRDAREIVLHPSGDILLGPTAKQNEILDSIIIHRSIY